MRVPNPSVVLKALAVALILFVAHPAAADEARSNNPDSPIVTALAAAPPTTLADAGGDTAKVGSESHDTALPVPAPKPDAVTVTITANVSVGRIFQEQEFILTRYPVSEVDITIANGDGWYIDFWRAQPLTGRNQDRETDIDVGKDTAFGAYTLRTDLGYFEFEGKDEWRVRFKVTRPLSDACGLAGYADTMRGALDTEVYKAEVSCSSKHWSVDGAIAHDRAFDATGLEGGIGWKPVAEWPLRFFAKGYAGNRGSGVIGGVDIFRVSFGAK